MFEVKNELYSPPNCQFKKLYCFCICFTSSNSDDLFNIADGGRITGSINGGGGTNTLQRSNTSGSNLWELLSAFAGNLNGDSFSNIQILVGSDQADDTLVARNQDPKDYGKLFDSISICFSKGLVFASKNH